MSSCRPRLPQVRGGVSETPAAHRHSFLGLPRIQDSRIRELLISEGASHLPCESEQLGTGKL